VPRTSRLVVGLLAAVVVGIAGCTLPVLAPTGSGTRAPTPGASGTLAVPGTQAAWRPCPEVPRRLVGRGASGMTYECASITVPRDWTAPAGGRTYGVELLRVRSRTQHDRIGSLLVNPGGPGVSGIDTAVYLTFGQALGGLPTAITDRFDIVGFDPRGVGRSDPIRCIDAKDQDAMNAGDPDPVSQPDFDEVVALNKRVAEGCGHKYGDQLSLFSTEQAAHDMEAIRAAVGDAETTYLGFSYGTLLGATYAQLYPKSIRALVLDGAVDPKQGMVASLETQARGFERAFTNFTTWCRAAPRRCAIAPDARGAVTDALAKAENSPVRGDDGREATPGWIFVGVVASLYTESSWQRLAQAIEDLQAGRAEAIFDLADAYLEREPNGSYSNLSDAFLTVNCVDATNAPSVDRIRQLQSQWRTKYPLFGAPLAVSMLPCAFWPGRKDPYPAGPAIGAPPIVVVGTTGDPATPYENTADLATMLGTGHVLTWEGKGHTAYPITPCIVNAVDAYLIDLRVPKEGLRCPAR
jgi:pimeloyl-ACP methyl ester carboxylesterase